MGRLTSDAKVGHAALNTEETLLSSATGAAHHHDYRIVFAAGVELEVTNCRSPDLAGLLASDLMRNRRRNVGAVVRTERMPFDARRHRERLAEIAAAAL